MNFLKFLKFKNILLGIAIFAVIIAILGFSGRVPIFKSKKDQKLTGTLRVWGTLPKNKMIDFQKAFDKEAKTYSLSYTEISENEFNNRLISSLADGASPDLIIAPLEILFSNEKRVQNIPLVNMPETQYRNTFIDASSILIDSQNGYLGFPVSIDPLILYYNRDILSSNGFLTAPTNWGELYTYTNKITKYSYSGEPKLSTIAFGTFSNIPYITDILLAMILQQGQNIVEKRYIKDSVGDFKIKYDVTINSALDDNSVNPLNSVLAFTKDFADIKKSVYNWSPKLNNALQEFLSGNLAFYIGYASDLDYIKTSNQKLYLDYAILPQVENSKILSTYGKLYVIFMLNTSPSPDLAMPVMQAIATTYFGDMIAEVVGGITPQKQKIAEAINSGDHLSEILGNSALISKSFYDLYHKRLDSLMKSAINQLYNGEKSSVEVSDELTETLQEIYDGEQ